MITQSSQPQDDLQGDFRTYTLFQKIQSTDWFIGLQETVKSQDILQTIFNQECPLELTGQCRVAGIKGDYVTLIVENGAIASKLQYQKRELLIALKKYPEYSVLKKIWVRIVPSRIPARQLEAVSPGISPEIAALFKSIAEDISDPELKQALLKFAQAT